MQEAITYYLDKTQNTVSSKMAKPFPLKTVQVCIIAVTQGVYLQNCSGNLPSSARVTCYVCFASCLC